MADRYAELAMRLKRINRKPGRVHNLLFNGVVKSVEGEVCTVTVDGLDLPDVRLRATVGNGNDAYLQLTPANGSNVLVGSMTGDLTDLAVLKADQVSIIEVKSSGIQVVLDMENGKINAENNGVSLKSLFANIVSIFNGLQLNHPQGPTTGLMPTSVQAVSQLQTDFNQLLN